MSLVCVLVAAYEALPLVKEVRAKRQQVYTQVTTGRSPPTLYFIIVRFICLFASPAITPSLPHSVSPGLV